MSRYSNMYNSTFILQHARYRGIMIQIRMLGLWKPTLNKNEEKLCHGLKGWERAQTPQATTCSIWALNYCNHYVPIKCYFRLQENNSNNNNKTAAVFKQQQAIWDQNQPYLVFWFTLKESSRRSNKRFSLNSNCPAILFTYIYTHRATEIWKWRCVNETPDSGKTQENLQLC